jgi:beta-1,4-mannosyltransferase
MEELNRESLGYGQSQSFAIVVGLGFMVLFRLIGYLATKTPKVGSMGKQGFCIVVLGDVGHSPRMLLHARSALNAGWRVDVIGYKGKVGPDPL